MATRVIREERSVVRPEDRPLARTMEAREDYYQLANIVYVIFGLLELLLGLRFVFLLLGANQMSGFVTLVYGLTGPLVAPFEGIFGVPSLAHATFDAATLVAMLVYAVLCWAIVRLIAAANRTPAEDV
jgi:hypothetical protein